MHKQHTAAARLQPSVAERKYSSVSHHGTLGELLELEDTHGAVPHDGLALLQGVGEGLDAVWANVQTLQTAEKTWGFGTWQHLGRKAEGTESI
jgi:hypothetical protein